jgi:hypothetical protein
VPRHQSETVYQHSSYPETMGENASAKNARKAMLMLAAEVSINAIAALYELEEVLALLHPKKLKILLLTLSFAS